MERKKLGVLLSTPPSHASVEAVAGLCSEALRADVDVYLYLIDEGVKNVADERLLSLSRDGAKLFVCAYGCQKHGIPTDSVSPTATLCGLVVLANIVSACDRFLAFN